MTTVDLANLIFPDITETIEDIECMYPKRSVDGEVTRFAPSPTGFMHIGGCYQAITDYPLRLEVFPIGNSQVHFHSITEFFLRDAVHLFVHHFLDPILILGSISP